jgi:hypothetical protein
MLSPKHLKVYFREARKLKREYPQAYDLRELIDLFPAWRRSVASHSSPLAQQTPWITFPAIRILERALKQDMRVYEFGAGGSTIFFARRVREVVSVEHDPAWFERVKAALEAGGHHNCRLELIEPVALPNSQPNDPADPDHYATDDATFRRHSFERYVKSIEEFPDACFDVILIDGRSRPSCFKHSLKKIRPDGLIVWDNTDRAYYQPAMRLAPANLEFLDFPGPTPHLGFFSRTSIWRGRRPGNDSEEFRRP